MSEQRTYWRHPHEGRVILDRGVDVRDPWERVHVLTDADLAARDADLVERIAGAIEADWKGDFGWEDDLENPYVRGMERAARIAREVGRG